MLSKNEFDSMVRVDVAEDMLSQSVLVSANLMLQSNLKVPRRPLSTDTAVENAKAEARRDLADKLYRDISDRLSEVLDIWGRNIPREARHHLQQLIDDLSL